jgi:hypothetical protein
MQLAADEISVKVGAERIVLRPTLRAALRLERRHGGFDKIVRAIADGSLTVIADVIREASDRYTSIPELIEQIGLSPLRVGIEALSVPLIDFVFALAGVTPADQSPGGREGEPATRISFADHHARLYRVATGWLGWSPETAWSSTPAEIMEAQKGRLELLRAIFGTADEGDKDQPSGPVEHSEAEIFESRAKLKMIVARGGNRVA